MPSPGFEPGSPRPQSKSDDLDRSAMGPAYQNSISLSEITSSFLEVPRGP